MLHHDFNPTRDYDWFEYLLEADTLDLRDLARWAVTTLVENDSFDGTADWDEIQDRVEDYLDATGKR